MIWSISSPWTPVCTVSPHGAPVSDIAKPEHQEPLQLLEWVVTSQRGHLRRVSRAGVPISTAQGPGPSLLSAALGCLQSSNGSIEKLISLLEGICQQELGLSCLSPGLKAQTGSGSRGADSGLAPPGNPGEATSQGHWGQAG